MSDNMTEERIRRGLIQIRSQFNRTLDEVLDSESLHQLGIIRRNFLERFEEYCELPNEYQRSSVIYDKRAMDMAWQDAVSRVMNHGSHHAGVGSSDTMRQESQSRSRPESHEFTQMEEGEIRDSRPKLEQELTSNLIRAVDRMSITYSFTFDGDPGNFVKFTTYFDRRFSSKSFDEFELMGHLVKSCSGRALLAIKEYEGVQGGYSLARRVLERRFGKPFEIVESTLAHVSVGPRFKPEDADGLNIYSSQLEAAYETLRSHGATAEANSEQFLVKIFNRLPQGLQQKWLGENQKIREEHQRNPKFREMVLFVIRMAEMSDTVYKVKPNFQTQPRPGVQPGVPRPDRLNSGGARVTTLTSLVQESQSEAAATPGVKQTNQPGEAKYEECNCCGGDHHIVSCSGFAAWRHWERRSLAQRMNLCYRCLGHHIARDCQAGDAHWCSDPSCRDERPHHPLMHRPRLPPRETNDNRPPKTPRESDSAGSTGGAQADTKNQTAMGSTITASSVESTDHDHDILLHIAPVRLCVGDRSVTTLGMLDNGSKGTLVEKHVLDLLPVSGTPEKLGITTVTGTCEDMDVQSFGCKIGPVNLSVGRFLDVPKAWAVDSLPFDKLTLPHEIQFYSHLQGLDLFGDVDVQRISVLIGQNVPEAHIQTDWRYGCNPAHEPYAVKTALGWSVAGPAKKASNSGPALVSSFVSISPEDVILEKSVEKLWNLERHGFENDDKRHPSVEDERCQKILEDSTRCVNGRYEASMLWKRDPPRLPQSRCAAQKRLDQLIRRFRRDPDFYERYEKEMSEYVNLGYARQMLASEASVQTPKTWYLPHHAVFNAKKPGKFRIVYDAAAQTAGVSLNSQLCTGPDLTNSLVGCLLRFRQHEVAVVADIQSMFHRVRVSKADQDALRYLWIPEGLDGPVIEYQMTSHVFGKKDSPTVCTFAMRQCARDQRENYSEESVVSVRRNFYVDDLLASVPSVESAIKLARELIRMMDSGGFRLTKFQSSRVHVLKALPPDRVAPNMAEVEFESDLPVERALGTHWNVEADEIGVQVDDTKEFACTRRGCLAQVCSTFDPLGIIAPVALIGKRILQAAVRLKIGWDDQLPEHLKVAWLAWRSELELLHGLSVRRCYFPVAQTAEITLHHFSDACEEGYGTVSYLRAVYPSGEVQVAFLMAKSRTTPSSFTTVPRLELHACVVAARVHSFLKRELDLQLSGSYFYTDSTISYQYITAETKRFHTYVANRTSEFRDLASPDDLYVIPGKLNPADEASRGCMPSKFLNNKRFLNGPDFLQLPPEQWPISRPGPLPADDTEAKVERFVLATVTERRLSLTDLIARYGSWTLLKRKTAYLQRVVDVLRSRHLNETENANLQLKTEDLLRAEKNLVKFVQSEYFADEIEALKHNQCVRRTSRLRKLNPQLDDDGVLRVGGRLRHSTLPSEQRFPMILPKASDLTRTVILHYHVQSGHSGCNHVLALIRERFWILHGRSVVRGLLHKCFTCRKYLATRMEQMMGDLPDVRTTTYVPPFQEATGIDFMGPFLVKRGRSQAKRYVCLFTCLHTRCVHLELACGLDTPSFMNCLRRHQARRGTSKTYWCDNGTNFVGAEREMKRLIDEWNKEQLQEEFVQQNTDFQFLPPTASHMAGVWERLVRCTKRVLYGVLAEQFVSDDVLTTALTETERILNSKPLTPVSSDPNDLEALTPNHMLLQRTFGNLPPGLFDQSDIYKSKYRQAQFLTEMIWKRFAAEYVVALQERVKWMRPRRNVDDVVLVGEKGLPRSRWLIGRVTETFVGRDGKVRSVRLQAKGSNLIRPIHKLALLEAAE